MNFSSSKAEQGDGSCRQRRPNPVQSPANLQAAIHSLQLIPHRNGLKNRMSPFFPPRLTTPSRFMTFRSFVCYELPD